MNSLTQPLRDEHRELRPSIDEILAIANGLGDLLPAAQVERLEVLSGFLHSHLLRHARAEETALYPVVCWAMHADDGTTTMARDHVEIVRMAEQLDDLIAEARDGQPRLNELRQVLYGLHAVVMLHFAKEEEVYLPLLDERLTADAAARLFSALEQAAALAA